MIDRETVTNWLCEHGVDNTMTLAECITAAQFVAQKAVEGQKQTRRETEAMAECMDMARQDLITAGVIGKSVPPMMLAEAVIASRRKAVDGEREAIAQEFDRRATPATGFYEPHEPAEIVRNRGIGGGE